MSAPPTEVVFVRVRVEVAAALDEAARARGMERTEYVRDVLERAARRARG